MLQSIVGTRMAESQEFFCILILNQALLGAEANHHGLCSAVVSSKLHDQLVRLDKSTFPNKGLSNS